MGDRLATIDMGRKEGEVGTGFPSNTMGWAEAYLHTKWHLHPSSRVATTDKGRKLGAVSLGEGGWVPI